MEKIKDTSKQNKSVKITVNEKWCKRCGICAAFCPQGVFVINDFGMPIVKYPEKCVKCMLCVLRCPDLAVEIKDIDEK